MRPAWVFECDRPCSKRLVVFEHESFRARGIAFDKGWESVLHAGPDGTSLRWLCPRHRHMDIGPEPEHEDWCPRKTRQSACACGAWGNRASVADQAVADVPWVRGITVIHPKGDIL